jgi:5-methylcytosine-specific restriction protein A
MKLFFAAASPEHQKKEKAKARELRQSSWWKQQRGKGICYHCGGRFPVEELTMDHLIPIARGGTSDKKNCVPSCKECNSKKGHQTRAEMAFEELEKQKQAAAPSRKASDNPDDSDENSSN